MLAANYQKHACGNRTGRIQCGTARESLFETIVSQQPALAKMWWLGVFMAAQKNKKQTTSGNNKNAADHNQFCRHNQLPSRVLPRPEPLVRFVRQEVTCNLVEIENSYRCNCRSLYCNLSKTVSSGRRKEEIFFSAG